MAQVAGVSSHRPKGCGFDSSVRAAYRKATIGCFSHMDVSLSLSPSLLLSESNLKKSSDEDKKIK